MTTTAQRTQEWRQARLGKITASEASKLLTEPKTNADKAAGVLAQTTKTYLLTKVAELFTGVSKQFTDAATEWGNNHEAEAVARYEYLTGNTTYECGFIEMEGFYAGASPDRLVEFDGLLEVKCPYNSEKFLALMIEPITDHPEYYPQIQFQLMVTGRDWCDFVAYDPRFPAGLDIHIVRVARDEAMIAKLRDKVEKAQAWITEKYNQLVEQSEKVAAI